MVVAMRSRGKTYGFLKEAVKDYVRDGSQFVLVRRYDTELRTQFPTCLDALIFHKEFPELEFKINGYHALVRPAGSDKKWDVIGFGVSLSKQANFKGTEFPRVKKIIFDEFIRETRTPPGYLRDDVGAFLNLFKTVSRDRDGVHAYLLGNSCDLTNPYFRFIGLQREPPEGYSWHNHKSVLVHYDNDAEFAAEELETTVGRLVAGTPYAQVMIGNEFAQANDLFIASKTKAAKFRYAIKFETDTFAVWMDYQTGLYYVNGKAPADAETKGEVYALTATDMTLNTYMLGMASPLIKSIMRLYRVGNVRFKSPTLRERFVRMLTLCGLR